MSKKILFTAWSGLLAVVAYGCTVSDGGGGNGSNANAANGGGGDANGSNANGSSGDMGPGPAPANRYNCPADSNLPQKVYGDEINAKNVLDADETWTPDNLYLISGHLHIGDSGKPATLTIAAGTVVCFMRGPMGAEGNANGPPGQINVETTGTIKVLGTSSKHVVFAQLNDYHVDYWNGISFGFGSFASSTMQYLDIYNAGVSDGGAVIRMLDSTGAPLDMQHVTFYSLARVGLSVLPGLTAQSSVLVNNYGDMFPTAATPDYYYNYPALTVHDYAAQTITATNFTVGTVPAAVKYLQLDHAEGALLTENVTLHKLQTGLVWRNIQNMKVSGVPASPAVFTLDPGVILAVNTGGYIQIGYAGGDNTRGDIVANGTATDPIKFTSDAFIRGETPKPGDWMGIEFFPPTFRANVSKFNYVIFEYGGSVTPHDPTYNCNDMGSDLNGELTFTRSTSGNDYDGPTVTNSTFRQALGRGIRAYCNGNGTGCLQTVYTLGMYNNTFEGFTGDTLRQDPKNCP